MLRIPLAASLSLSAAALLAAAAQAQTIPSPYRFVDERQAVEGFVGHVWGQEGELGLGPESGTLFGGRYLIRLTGPMSGGGEIAYFPASRAVVDTTGVRIGSADVDLLMVFASLRLDLTGPRTWHRLMPFVEFLGGVVVDVAGEQPDDAQLPAEARFDFGTSFAGGFGGGVDVFATSALALRASLRDVLWKLETPEPIFVSDVAAPRDQWVQNLSLTLGLSYRF